jgi:hypothetical protein
MVNDYVAVFPTQGTLDFLQQVLSSCPFDLSPSTGWHIPLLVSATSLDASLLNPSAVYSADPVSAETWYDDFTGRSDLVIVFNSTDIKGRHTDLCKQANVTSEQEVFVPAMPIVYGFPSLSAPYKTFINSLNMTLIGDQRYFDFTGEVLLDSNGYSPYNSGSKFFTRRMVGE